MLCERESAKAFWKISFQPLKLKIPLKDKKWVSLVGLWRRHLWRQNSNSNLYVGISNKFCLQFENFCPRNMFGVKHRPWSCLGLVQFFETETVLVSEGPIPRYVRYGGKQGLLYVHIALLRTYTPMYRSRMVPDLTSPRQYQSMIKTGMDTPNSSTSFKFCNEAFFQYLKDKRLKVFCY